MHDETGGLTLGVDQLAIDKAVETSGRGLESKAGGTTLGDGSGRSDRGKGSGEDGDSELHID